MCRGISMSPGLLVCLVILPIALALPCAAVAQEWDLGPIPDVVIECFAESEGAGSLAPDSSLDGSWLQVRRDRKLTGRSPLIGDITCPQVLWAYDTADARRTWFSVNPDSTNAQLTLPTVGSGSNGDPELDFEIRGYEIDLDGDGSQLVNPLDSDSGARIGDFLPALAGFERISCQPDVLGLTPDPDEPVPCYLQNRSNGVWGSPLWVSDPISGMIDSNAYRGTPIVGDFDDDGDMEVAVKGWYYISILDLNTGVVEKVGTFRDPNAGGEASGRAYGWWGAINIDNDPKLEIVILGDFEQFISLFGWVNGELEEIWDYEIEAGVNNPTAKHDTGVAPVADVDGDGLPEIVTSIYNETGDQRWHVMGFDGASGAKEIDLVDQYLTGLEDLDGDGVAELFVSARTNPSLPDYGDISILSFDGGVQSTIWSAQNKGFVSADIPGFPDSVHRLTQIPRLSLFYRSGWTTGRPVFLTKEDGGNGIDVVLHVLQFDQGQVTEIASLNGPWLSLVSLPSMAPQNGILFRAYTQDPAEGPVSLTNLSGNIESYRRVDHTDGAPRTGAGLLGGTVIGPLSAGASPTLVTQGFGEQLIALRIDDGLAPSELWRESGRGMITLNESAPYENILLADVLGTGDLAVISARKGSDGLGEVSALDSQGAELWNASFNVPGDLPPWNEGGVTNWTAGHFRSNQYEDVIAHIRISTEGSSSLHLLNGQTGVTEWVQTVGATCDGVVIGGAGGMHMPVFDWDADGLDEMLAMDAGIAVYNGDQAEILLFKITHQYCPPYVFAEPFGERATGVVADFLNNGTEQFLYGANPATLGVLDFNANVLWNTPIYDGLNLYSLQGIGDLDGIGGLEIVSVGHDDPGKEIYAVDAATGAERWTLAMPEFCELERFSHVAMGDIDGDGRDEALFNDCNFLYAIGENNAGQGEILWRAKFLDNRYDADLGEVVIADVDGSGRPQILINTSSGYLYGLGKLFIDTDGDGVPDDEDAFPNDPNESVDTDGDGIGNNADTDDDGDTMPDDFESANGLDPLNAADADADADGDGFTNLEEFQAGTKPQNPADYPGVRRAPVAIFILLDEDVE